MNDNQTEPDYTHPDEMPTVEHRPNPHSDLRGTIVHFTGEMLDSPDNYGIYPTTNFYSDLGQAIIGWHQQEIAKAQVGELKSLQDCKNVAGETLVNMGTDAWIADRIAELSNTLKDK